MVKSGEKNRTQRKSYLKKIRVKVKSPIPYILFEKYVGPSDYIIKFLLN